MTMHFIRVKRKGRVQKRPYYNTCPYCGSNLDPGERCICLDDISNVVAFNEPNDCEGLEERSWER